MEQTPQEELKRSREEETSSDEPMQTESPSKLSPLTIILVSIFVLAIGFGSGYFLKVSGILEGGRPMVNTPPSNTPEPEPTATATSTAPFETSRTAFSDHVVNGARLLDEEKATVADLNSVVGFDWKANIEEDVEAAYASGMAQEMGMGGGDPSPSEEDYLIKLGHIEPTSSPSEHSLSGYSAYALARRTTLAMTGATSTSVGNVEAILVISDDLQERYMLEASSVYSYRLLQHGFLYIPYIFVSDRFNANESVTANDASKQSLLTLQANGFEENRYIAPPEFYTSNTFNLANATKLSSIVASAPSEYKAGYTFFSTSGPLSDVGGSGALVIINNRTGMISTGYLLPTVNYNWKTGLIQYQGSEYNVRNLVYGCGGFGGYIKLPSAPDLKKFTAAFDGKDIYAAPWGLNPDIDQLVYENWLYFDENGRKPSIEQYKQWYKNPYLIQQNALGEWIVYGGGPTGVMAECGKPVIYLYPETTTNVSVKLPPFINVTQSEPTYPKQGWNVTAQPNGELTYKNASYGSLFWEGTGVGYAKPTTGYRVRGADVESFLRATLPKYGLQGREIDEFMEFWVPLMKDQDVMRVSFLTDAFDQAAPLAVSPKPATLIRVFMDWEPISEKTVVPASETPTAPARKGFTLVEWGGLLRK